MLPHAVGRDDILMAHEHNGFIRAFALPVIQQIAVYLGLFELFVHEWEQLLQHLVKAQKLFYLRVTGVGHCLVPDHLRKLFCVKLGAVTIRLRCVVRHLFRHECRAHGGNCKRREHCRGYAEFFNLHLLATL